MLFASATATAQPPSGPPVNGSLPTVKGHTLDGKKLKATPGSWSGEKPLTYSYSWERCDAAGGECAPIPSAKTAVYEPGTQDVGHTLRALVTAANGEGSATAASAASAKVAPAAPKKSKAPTIAGTPRDGQLLSATPGTWKGTEPISFRYQWQLCQKSACSSIAGATGSSYRPMTEQIGSKLEVVVTGTNAGGSSSAHSKKSASIVAGPPVSVGAPGVGGLPVVGQTLTAEVGDWAGTGPFEFAYQWLGCNLLGECTPISGAQGPTYTVGPLQVANSIEVEVTAKSSLGSASATSPPTNAISALLPANLQLPSITGLLKDGGLLTALTGSWSGTEPLSFSYQWELCNSAGGACKEISGELGSTLALLAADVGSTVRVAVTATNSAGSTTATSEPTSLIGALLPSNLELPGITGLLQDGSSLTAAIGSWSGTGPISYGYQWLLCDASGGSCKEVSGATGGTLGLLTSMIGSTVRLVVTATNSAGSTSATSEPSSVIAALLPSNTKLPSIGGLLEDGSTLTGALGSWSGSEPTFSYQWLLCNGAGASCKEISGAVGTTLRLITSEIGDTVRLVVTATNSAGSTSATSEPSNPILAILPKDTSLPTITGELIDTKTLTGVTGAWTGSEPSFSYQWLLCNGAGASCKEISGAIGSTLGLITSEIGDTVRLVVTATNSRGSTSATSEPTSLIGALLPSNTKLPSIAGELIDTKTLTGGDGSWSGSEPISYSNQWELCYGAGKECKAISGAIGSTVALISSEVGDTVRLAVKATNAGGSTTAFSEPTSLIGALIPSNVEAPSIAGILQTGHVLEVLVGKWNGTEPKYTFQWQSCGLLGIEKECVNIKEAIKKTFELNLSWVGLTLRVLVTATNSAGSATKASPITTAILGLLLTPDSGSTSGGTAVTLAAPGVAKATAVHFGSKKASEIEVDSPDEITAVSPPGTEGTVPVTVSTPEGSSHENPEDQFTYDG